MILLILHFLYNSTSQQIIEKGLIEFGKELSKLAKKHKYTVCIGRSHGIHAEATTFD